MKTFWIVVFCCCNTFCAYAQAKPAKRPNIIWIIAEDLSSDLGCYGNTLVRTPHLDALARRGMRFTNVFATAPVCSPSRTALATGMYQTSIGAYHMRYPDALMPTLPSGVQTIAQLSQAHGYLSANIRDAPGKGKTDWMFQADLEKQFDAHHWKALARQDQPFFAQLSTGMTHRAFAKATPGQFALEEIPVPPYYPDHPVTRRDFADYYASIEQLDREVGQVLDSLKKYGFDQNTVIFFFSDHGRPMSRGKNYHYDSGLKVPLIVSIPEGLTPPAEYRAGQTLDGLLSTIDITATTLAMMGIPKPEYLQGQVFWGKDKEAPRAMVFSATNRIGEIDFRSRSVRSERYRYSRHYHHDFSVNSSATAYRKAMHPIYHLLNLLNEQGQLTEAQKNLLEEMPYEELYAIRNDPFEIHNLANDRRYTATLDSMRLALDHWIETTTDQGLGQDPPAVEEAFAAYGEASRAKYAEKIEALHQQVKREVTQQP